MGIVIEVSAICSIWIHFRISCLYDSPMVSDAGRKIARIDYDYLNNPIRIQFTNGNVTKYVYSATGEKLRVIYQTAVPNITVAIGSSKELASSEIQYADSTDYLLGGALTLKNGRIDKFQFEEGYCQAEKYNATQDNFTFCYYDQDHLGNIRQVTKADGSTKGKIIQKMHYYPFGAQLCDGTTDSNVQLHRYNGKEYDRMHGLNTYDYGARQYNPVTARWDRVDPKAEKYYNISPYAYCANNPVIYMDPDGRDGIISLYGNNIIIGANIYLYGDGATKSVLRQMQNDVYKAWGKSFSIEHNEKKFNVRFDIHLSLYGGKEKSNPLIIADSWNPFNRDNFIRVSDDNNRSKVNGGDEGVWRSKGRLGMSLAEDDPAPHEVGHLLGLHDKYTDKSGTFKGWDNNIMGDSKNGVVENRNINEILEKMWIEYDKWLKDGNTEEFKYEINP